MEDVAATFAEVRALARVPGPRQTEPATGTSIGIEIGPSALHAGTFDRSGRLLDEVRRGLEKPAGPGEALDAAAELILALAAREPSATVLGVGAVLAEPIDFRQRIVSGTGSDDWAGVDVAAELRARTGFAVALENDANAAALAEHRFGAGRGSANLLYLRLSPRVGAALILGHRLYRGATGIAGELGHVSLSDSGPLCGCGNRGCLQAVTGRLELTRRGERPVRRLVRDAGVAIGTVVAGAVNLLSPSRVVVGGAPAGTDAPLLDAIEEGLRRHARTPTAARVEIVAGELGARAAIRGAASVPPVTRLALA